MDNQSGLAGSWSARPPSCPEQSFSDDENGETCEGRQEMEEIQVAHGEVNSDGTAESSAAHHRDNFNQTPVQLGTSRHEQKQTADRAQPAAEAGSIMGNDGDQPR